MAGFTHFDKEGKARMVDVSDKAETERSATAKGSVIMQPATLALIKDGGVKKGDVLSVARLAGIMGAKKTPDLIPLCHPLALTSVQVDLTLDEVVHAMRKHKVAGSRTAVWRFFQRHQITFKKSVARSRAGARGRCARPAALDARTGHV